MIESKVGTAGVKRSSRKSTNRKLDIERDPGGVAGVPDSGNGGLGVSGEWKEEADMKFFAVRDSSITIEIKTGVKGRNLYLTVKEGTLVAAIIHDLFRLCLDLNYPEGSLNIRKVDLCIQKEIQEKAQIELTPTGKRFLVEFLKRHPFKLSGDSPDAQLPLELEGLTDEEFRVLKMCIMELACQCVRELEEKIIGAYRIQGRQKMDEAMIPPYLALPEDNGSLGDRIQAVKVQFAEVVAELNGNSMEDAKSGAVRNEFITHIQVELRKLKSVSYLEDGALFYNPYAPQA